MPRSFILPGQPTRYTRDRTFNIDHTKLELSLDFKEKSIKGKVTHKVSAVGRKISSVELDAAELSIASIKVNDKEISNYETRSRSVLIPLGFEMAAGNQTELQIEYSARPRRGLYFREPNKDFPNWKRHGLGILPIRRVPLCDCTGFQLLDGHIQRIRADLSVDHAWLVIRPSGRIRHESVGVRYCKLR